MAFFEDLSRKVQDVAFAAAEKGKEVAAIASEKAQDAADTVKTNVAIAGEQRAIEKNYRAIGEWYVSALEGDAPEAVADIVAAIKDSQDKLAAYEATKAEAAAAKAEAAAAKKAQEPIIEVTIEKDAEEKAPAAEEPKEPSEAEETKED